MKRLIIALSGIAAVLAIALLLIETGVFDGAPQKPAQPVATTVAPTQPEITAPPTAAQTTAPQPQPELCEQQYVLNGVRLTVYTLEGELLAPVEEFANAAGLGADGNASAADKALLQPGDDDTPATLDGEPLTSYYGGALYLPLQRAIDAFGYPDYVLDGIHYLTSAARALPVSENVNVPVLMYHAVSDEMWGIDELFVSPSSMDAQLAYLTENGYDAIWFEDLTHLEDYDKPIILTFDDGYDDNYTELFPLLKKYGVKATIFVIGNAPGTSHKATEAQIKEMSDSGLVSIQSHGYTHADMDSLSRDALIYEMDETQKVLARITGKVPYVLCYPTGKYNDTALEVAKQYYQFGIKMVGGLYNTADDPLLVSRYYVSRYTDIGTFAAYLEAAGTE